MWVFLVSLLCLFVLVFLYCLEDIWRDLNWDSHPQRFLLWTFSNINEEILLNNHPGLKIFKVLKHLLCLSPAFCWWSILKHTSYIMSFQLYGPTFKQQIFCFITMRTLLDLTRSPTIPWRHLKLSPHAAPLDCLKKYSFAVGLFWIRIQTRATLHILLLNLLSIPPFPLCPHDWLCWRNRVVLWNVPHSFDFYFF